MLFTANKYTRWYYDIIDRAKTRILSANNYYEKHHIIPKSLGGSNSADNLVNLSAREHFATMQKNKLAKKLAQEKQNS